MTFIVDGTNGLTFPNTSTQASGGKVIQVVQNSYKTQVAVTGTTYTDTGLTATITPLFSTSKIMVLITQPSLYIPTSGTASGGGIKVLRNTSTVVYQPGELAAPDGPFDMYSAAGALYVVETLNFTDSPASTSALTYKTQARPFGNSVCTAYYQFSGSGQQQSSYITLMEIAA